MIKSILKFSLLGLLAIGVAGTPVVLRAQDTPAAPATPPAAKKPSNRAIPFHGKLKAVDNTAKTISVGEQTIQITSDTKITKAAKPATLEDGTVGDDVAGSYRKDADGKMNAVSLRFGPKPVADASQTKTNKPAM